MLDVGRYLLGVLELGLIVGFALLGATTMRRKLVPELSGAVAHLAAAVLGIAGLLWVAQALGSFGWFEVVPFLVAVVVIGGGTWALGRGSCRGMRGACGRATVRPRPPSSHATRGRGVDVATLIALGVALMAIIHVAAGVRLRLSTGMTGFDSTWYHGPFAAGFFQSGDTWGLHFIAPQFLAWFYPANSEVLHAVGMITFSRDILSPLLNLGWFVGCLVAGWCIGRPYKVAPFSLGLTAVALSVPALSDQAGEARNDIVGIFFLLAAVAVVLNAWSARAGGERGLGGSALAVVGLAAGLAAGTKLNFLLPAAVLVAGMVVVAPRGARWRALGIGSLAALAGGGYWYLRNLAHAGNPLPWIKHLGPITLPAPGQTLGGREAHSILGYLTDGSVWTDWFLPGLHHGLTILWPLALAAALAALVMSLGRRSDPMLRVAGAVGLAAAFAWLIAPTSASGPDGMPHGFESGLRYLAPALVLGLAVLPPTLLPRVARWRGSPIAQGAVQAPEHMGEGRRDRTRGPGPLALTVLVALVAAIALGYPLQRHYLQDRYANPTFTTPGLNAAFKWAQGITDSRIATTSTRQYPLYGRDLSNHVDYIGIEHPHGGFTAPTTCQAWRRLLNEGNYDYVVTSRDRIEPGKPPYPPTARWAEAPSVTVVLHKPPTVVYKLKNKLTLSGCRR